MFANLIGVDGLGIDVEVAGNAGAETGGVEDGARADDFLGGEAGKLHGIIGEDIHRVSNDKEDAVKAAVHDLLDHTFQNIGILLEEIHTGLAGLLGGAGGDDDDIAIFGVFVGAVTYFDVAGGDGKGVAKVHGFALGVFSDNIC